MYILGINSVYHESSACLLKDGQILSIVEEERFNRVKHAKSATIDSPGLLPVDSIKYCLEKAKIRLDEVDKIGFSIEPMKRLDNISVKEETEARDWGSNEGETIFHNNLMSVPNTLYDMNFKGNFYWMDHHLAHAASAYYPSPFENAAVLAIDGIGEISSSLLAIGEMESLKGIEEILYPASLGFLWEKICKFIGFSEYDACKVMGLAAYGQSKNVIKAFQKCVQIQDNGMFSVDNSILKFRKDDYQELEALFDVPRRTKNMEVTQKYMDIAAGLQRITEEAIINFVNHAQRITQAKNLCLSGGVALNCTANMKLFSSSKFENMYIQPAANDAGTALGSALLIWHNLFGNDSRNLMSHAYWGPSYEAGEIEQVLLESGVEFQHYPNIEEKVAQLLEQGKIVGWFQGAMEFGPRALGNRSLLASPQSLELKDRLNRIVKKREDFRPFAPSVLAEEASKWFDIPKPCIASDFMLLTYKANEKKRDTIPAVLHIDGTSRIQTVKKTTNPKYYKLIDNFFKLTGVPMLLNTSFNNQEPIVCSPKDALNTYFRSEIDCLAIENYLISKKTRQQTRQQ